jgi:hypothetical protein
MRSRYRAATAGFAVGALVAVLFAAVTPARAATSAVDSPSVVDALPSLGTAGGLGDSTSDPGTAASDSSSIDTVVADPSLYADDSGAVTAGAVTDTANATPAGSQCTTPLSQRSGAWACVTGSSPLGNVTAATPGAPSAADTAGLTGYCRSFSGCWWRYDDFHADFQSSQFSYGFGSTNLGSDRCT